MASRIDGGKDKTRENCFSNGCEPKKGKKEEQLPIQMFPSGFGPPVPSSPYGGDEVGITHTVEIGWWWKLNLNNAKLGDDQPLM